MLLPVGGRGEEERRRRRVFQLRHSSACLREKPKVKPCENMDDSPIDFPFVPFVSPSFIPRCFTPFSLSLVLLCFFLQLFLSLKTQTKKFCFYNETREVSPNMSTIQWFRVDPSRLEQKRTILEYLFPRMNVMIFIDSANFSSFFFFSFLEKQGKHLDNRLGRLVFTLRDIKNRSICRKESIKS